MPRFRTRGELRMLVGIAGRDEAEVLPPRVAAEIGAAGQGDVEVPMLLAAMGGAGP